jgi:hypothetical protein
MTYLTIDTMSTIERNEKNNHDIILAIINDIVRMQQNIDYMDDSIKGVSQLRNRLKSIYATLNSNQYEIPNLIGRTYHEGDNMIGTLELNSDLETGTNRIKRVIKPQVSYQGKLIQAAEVVIEYNE